MPRVRDAAITPSVEPNVATRATLRAFADRLRIEGTLHINRLRQIIDELIEDLEAGRAESISFCALDAKEAIDQLVGVILVGQQVQRTIVAFDPAYDKALAPARREQQISNELRAMRTLDTPTLMMLAQGHSFACKDPTCATHEALRRALAPLSKEGPNDEKETDAR